MTWGGNSARKWGRKPTHKRGTVVWSDNSGAKPAPFVQQMPHYREPNPIPEKYVPFLEAGTLWKANVAMNPQQTGGQFPTLLAFYYPPDAATVKINSFLIYAGVVRHEERQSNGRIVTVPRHTFIAAGGRYIVTEFYMVSPLDLPSDEPAK